MIYKKFPGGGGNSPQFPAIPVVVRGRMDILSVLEVSSGRLRELSVHRSIQNVLAAPGTPHPPTQALAYYNKGFVEVLQDFKWKFPYCIVLACGGRVWG